MLIVFRPFHVGDRIETGGVGGTTREVNLFYTEIDGDDNARIVIPNGKLWGEIVRVPTRNDTARLHRRFHRPAHGARDAAVTPLIERDSRVVRLADIGIDSVADGNYVLAAHVWVKHADQAALRFDLNRVVKDEFDRPAAKPGPAAVERRAGSV